MMWIFRKHSAPDSNEANYWLEHAIRYTTPLEPRKNDHDVHDLGFLFLSTYYRWWRLTGDPAHREVLIEAGRTLAQRFKEKGQYLRSFVGDNSLFIDIMMNVGIIFFAARETGDRRLRDIAMRHSHHHAARAGAGRRLHRAGRNFRHRHRRVPAPDHASGLPRRFLLVARAGLGDVRIHYLLRVQPRSAFPATRRKPAPISTSRTRPPMAFRHGISTRLPKIARCRIRPRRRSARRDCCACAVWCPIR